MKHFTTPGFWELYKKLIPSVQKTADKNFSKLKTNPNHPSLHLKKVKSFWSARIGKKYRTLAVENSEGLIWFWIGNHSDYDRLLSD